VLGPSFCFDRAGRNCCLGLPRAAPAAFLAARAAFVRSAIRRRSFSARARKVQDKGVGVGPELRDYDGVP
jgi:hypothetical protein